MQLALLPQYQFPTTAPLRYFGGKWDLAKWIVPILGDVFPNHKHYIEPYGGGFGVGFQKRAVDTQVYNEINPAPLHFFRTLKNRPGELIAAIAAMNWDDQEYHNEPSGPIDRAARIYLKARTGFTGAGGRWDCGISRNRMDDRDHYDIQSLLAATDMLCATRISNKPAMRCIKDWDCSDALLLVDPPYLHAARGTKDSRRGNPAKASPRRQYQFEMTEAEHIDLVMLLRSVKAGVILCGHDSPLYDSLCDGWIKHSHRDSQECLWIKRPRYLTQLSLV